MTGGAAPVLSAARESSDMSGTPTTPERYTSPRGIVWRRAGTGPPAVLLHGSGGSWRHWVRNISAVAERRTAILPDLPGFGESADIDPDVSLEGYAAAVAEGLASALDPRTPIDIIGFSFGALIAAELAHAMGARVRAALFISLSGFPKPAGRVLGRRPRSAAGSLDASELREFHRQNLAASMFGSSDAIDELALDIQAEGFERSRFDNRGLSRSAVMPGLLTQLRCPVHLLFGAQDRMIHPLPAARAALCRETRPDASINIVEGAGHWLAYERATETNRLIARFLDDPRAGAAGVR